MVVKNLDTCLNVLKYFANISGLRINYDKTQVIWIGNMKYSNHRLNAGNALEWGKHQFKLLGIEFDVDLDKIFGLNFKQKYEQLKKKTMKNWNRRNHTPLGRLTVLKTIFLPQLSPIFASLPNPSDSQLKNLESCYGK